MLSSFFRFKFLLWRLIDVEVDTYSVLHTVAYCGDCDRVGVVEVTGSATSHRADASQRKEKQGRIGDEAGQFAGRATGVTQAKERQQEEAKRNGRDSARPVLRRLR